MRGKKPHKEKATGGAVRWFIRAALVLTTLTLFAFLAAASSQACTNETGPKLRISVIVQTTPQISEQQLISNRPASIAKSAIRILPCCTNGLGHCPGLDCAGSSCYASGIAVTTLDCSTHFSPIFEDQPPQLPPHSVELDAQFRPPQIVA